MKAIVLTTKSQLKKFIKLPFFIYKNDELFVPQISSDLYKTLVKLCLKEKSYTALAVVDDKGKFKARLLFTVAPSKQLKLEKCGYFSHFECENDEVCATLLFDKLTSELKKQNVTHVEGTYFPFDQDNRRGIQICGFEDEPMIFTSYNPPYYQKLLIENGFKKDFDTLSYRHSYEDYDYERVEKVSEKLYKQNGLYITKVDFNNIERELKDVNEIMTKATNEIIFQEAPSIDDLRNIVGGWKKFLWEDLILIARTKEGDKPVGMVMAIPNFYYVFRKMKGKTDLFALLKLLHYKNKITSMRIMLQYVIPEYQNRGTNFLLYHELYKTSKAHGINYVESGTIMENNFQSKINVEKAGGKLNKIFRIYGKKIWQFKQL